MSVILPRGGSMPDESVQTRKRKKKKNSKANADFKKEKETIEEALKQKDSAKALGDAVRSDRTDDWFETDPLFNRLDASVTSVGWAMGTSDDDGGSVEAAPSSVVAHYLLKSHGGAHALQSVCSLFAVLLSIGACLSPSGTKWQVVFLKRAMLCAMTKHLAGLLAATGMTASAIPKVGLGQARQWMEELARDPVSQYVFYAALVMVWLSSIVSSKMATSGCWFMSLPVLGKYTPLVLVGPVLLREAISVIFVVSDILLLLHQTSTATNANPVAGILWKAGHSTANAILSLLVTPSVWRNATVAQRQAILARLVAKVSLVLELAVGVLIAADAIVAICEVTLLTPRPSLLSVFGRVMCARLFVNFLWVRRSKIRRLQQQLRGGAAEVPVRILDALYDPFGAMGIKPPSSVPHRRDKWNWRDNIMIVLGLDEDT